MMPEVCVVNVIYDRHIGFEFNKCLKGEYELELLAGQHITACDSRLLNGYTTLTDVPELLQWKQVELYANLSSTEKTLLVQVANSKIIKGSGTFEKVCCLLGVFLMQSVFKVREIINLFERIYYSFNQIFCY